MRLLKSKRILDNTNTLAAKLVPWIESLREERPNIAYIINAFLALKASFLRVCISIQYRK